MQNLVRYVGDPQNIALIGVLSKFLLTGLCMAGLSISSVPRPTMWFRQPVSQESKASRKFSKMASDFAQRGVR